MGDMPCGLGHAWHDSELHADARHIPAGAGAGAGAALVLGLPRPWIRPLKDERHLAVLGGPAPQRAPHATPRLPIRTVQHLHACMQVQACRAGGASPIMARGAWRMAQPAGAGAWSLSIRPQLARVRVTAPQAAWRDA